MVGGFTQIDITLTLGIQSDMKNSVLFTAYFVRGSVLLRCIIRQCPLRGNNVNRAIASMYLSQGILGNKQISVIDDTNV